ncbi:glycosyltransferase family 2 protein [Piscinibacter sakaiensis]|uniref:glycosyltransferase family 2 protein n=1 Tax=Piscinibacter sakaiensis TaxID=1547922 RepID=UPI003AAC7710
MKMLSIVVPTYRRPQTLERALASVAAATSTVAADREVIVVDDCADGSGFDLARRFGARYVCKAGQQRGLSASRNIGLALAGGAFVTFLDDDDFFNPGGLDALLAGAAGHEGIVFGNHSTFDTERRTVHNLAALTLDHLLVCNRIPVGAYLLRRAAVAGTFDERLRSHEDWEFLLRQATRLPLRHVAFDVVSIDKTANATTSMQARRRRLFWLDFLSIYARFPAAHLTEHRSAMMTGLGLQMPPEMLRFADEI